ncbi:60S ribosomal protein L27 [Babesia caballi]|uniref:60S ribosomal protein L27 n=1 Tax=Babesia caballi TaxID=5871 RepID=A0AAV4LTL0_BABCB|nr:60S ribosomal protein L27 [Babesia caballi]
MSRRQPGPRFQRIPHFDIGELLPPESIIIVHSDAKQGLASDSDAPSDFDVECEPPYQVNESPEAAPKRRRTDDAPSSVPAAAPSPRQVLPTEILDCELKEELPTCHTDLFDFKDNYAQLMERLDTLRDDAAAVRKEQLKAQLGNATEEDLDTLCKLKAGTSVMQAFLKPIRTPTITEVIWSAANMNLKHVLADRALSGSAANKRLDISVNEKVNKWSEARLYQMFADTVDLESYQLAVGETRYSYRTQSSKTDASHPLTLSAPQNHSTAPMFHRNATQRYIDEHGRSSLTLIPDDEVIITLSLYHSVRGHKLREYDMLSSQTLTDLRNAFHCPSEVRPVDGGLDLQGSCFMINGQLFPDLQDEACDYSEPLLRFFERFKPETLRTTECVEQRDAILRHMELPIYIPGFLLHHGDCEHRLMITAIRAFDPVRDSPINRLNANSTSQNLSENAPRVTRQDGEAYEARSHRDRARRPPYANCLVAGVDKHPLKVSKKMSKEKIQKRLRIKPFVKYINVNHLMPTRYTVTGRIDPKTLVTDEQMESHATRKEARKALKAVLEEALNNPDPTDGKVSKDTKFLRKKLRF